MHKRLQNGLHRFTGVENITSAWSDWFTMLKRNRKLQTFLDDKGKGEPGQAYLKCVERCLRKFALQKLVPFGAYAMDSYSNWTQTSFWKKREAYIAAVRTFKGLGSYNKYIAYNWNDYVFRLRVGKTFLHRHFQHSNGSVRLDIPDPPVWALPPRRRRKKFSRKKTRKKTHEDDKLGEESEEGEAETGPSQEWDSEEGEFVTKE